MAGHFGIKLSFYDKDADAAKVVVVTFDCKEQTDTEMEALEQSSEEFKAHEKINTTAKRRDNKLQTTNKNIGESIILDAMSQQGGMKPMEFSVLYLIQR